MISPLNKSLALVFRARRCLALRVVSTAAPSAKGGRRAGARPSLPQSPELRGSNNRDIKGLADTRDPSDPDVLSLSSLLATSPTRTQRQDQPKKVLTHIPRNPNIRDGAWNPRDDDMVRAALIDADERNVNNRKAGQALLGQSVEQLSLLADRYSQPAFRGRQMYEALLKGGRSINDFHTLPKEWRTELQADGYRTGRSVVHQVVKAPDGTRKFLLRLADDLVVETVGIPSVDPFSTSLTVCVSSQVGCPMRCTFCATGKGGFARNLEAHEIIDQVLTVQEQFDQRVTNVVYMGMGEPLLNIANVVDSLHFLNKAVGIGARYLTVSTVGVVRKIPLLAEHKLQATLAVSIHAPNQKLRAQLIPSAKVYPIDDLMKDCATYFKVTGRRVTFEYTLLSGVNDAPDLALELAGLLKHHHLGRSHVNVIPWNPVDESDFQRPSKSAVIEFMKVLERAGISTTMRVTRGMEAAAACGQLRNLHQKQPLSPAGA